MNLPNGGVAGEEMEAQRCEESLPGSEWQLETARSGPRI